MQTILIPTDFNNAAFDGLPSLCEKFGDQPVNLVFTHLFNLSDSISDLLMLSRRNKEFEYVSDDFYRECQGLKGRFPQLNEIRIDFFYGGTLAAFKAFTEANQISYILDPSNCSYTRLNKRSIGTDNLVERAGVPVLKITPARYANKAPSAKAAEVEMLEAV